MCPSLTANCNSVGLFNCVAGGRGFFIAAMSFEVLNSICRQNQEQNRPTPMIYAGGLCGKEWL